MTSTTYAVANVRHALMALKEKIEPSLWNETPLPVIVAPGWWLADLCREMNVEPGDGIHSIHDCRVMESDHLTEPMLLDHDGKLYPILPAWMRAKQAAAE